MEFHELREASEVGEEHILNKFGSVVIKSQLGDLQVQLEEQFSHFRVSMLVAENEEVRMPKMTNRIGTQNATRLMSEGADKAGICMQKRNELGRTH